MTGKPPDGGTPRRASQAPLLEEQLTREIIGAFYEVYNILGYGFLESVYARALERELKRRGLRVEREVWLDVYYKGECVGAFRADMLVESRVVVENKATARLSDGDRHQLRNYLRCSVLEVGLLLHFGPRPAFQRVVAENRLSSDPAISSVSASSSFRPNAPRTGRRTRGIEGSAPRVVDGQEMTQPESGTKTWRTRAIASGPEGRREKENAETDEKYATDP